MATPQDVIQMMTEAQLQVAAGNRAGADATAAAAAAAASQLGNADLHAAVVNHANSWGPTAPAPAPSGGGGGGGGGGGDTRSAYDAQMDYLRDQETARQNNLISTMRVFMNENDMGALLDGMVKYVKQGYTGDQLWIMVSNDDAYKAAYNERFAANEARKKAGLSQLLPATYIELEKGYRSAMMSRGMPEGLFDENDDFTNLIANDVSVVEVEGRLDTALDYINFEGNSAVKSELREIYGLTDGEMAAYVLDPDRTLDYLERESKSSLRKAAVGGSATNAGADLSDALRDEIANKYGASSWERTFADTSSGFTTVAQETPLYDRLALLSNEEASSDDLVKGQFNLAGAAEAKTKKGKLASQERARFSGSSGISKTSLAQKRVR